MTVLSDRVDVLEATNANLVSILTGLSGNLQGVLDAGQGVAGWSPLLTVTEDGARRVLRVTDWTGGGGTKPAVGQYLGPSGWVATAAEAVDLRGAQGNTGATGATGDGWTGATYDAATGVVTFTSDDGLGFVTGDLRGAQGIQGVQGDQGIQGVQGDQGDAGWSPVFAIATDGARRVLQVTDWTGGAGTKPAVGQYVGVGGLVALIADGVDIRGPEGAAGAGSGDMTAAVYDPGGVAGDVYARANHTGTQLLATIADAGTAAAADAGDFATAAQGALADSAAQPADVSAALSSAKLFSLWIGA